MLLLSSSIVKADGDDWVAPLLGGILLGNAMSRPYQPQYYYAPPPPVYYAPQPVPVYVQPPVYMTPPQYYYRYPQYYGRDRD